MTRQTAVVNTSGQAYLEALGTSFPANAFETRFSKMALRIGLGSTLDANELNLLFRSSFWACLCNISFNGLGGCGGEIRPKRELHRIKLEREFMAAEDQLFNTAGWRKLNRPVRARVESIFLRVQVADENLAADEPAL